MQPIFADTFYWTALINPRDQWHQQVKALSPKLSQQHLVTMDEVLIEFLNFFSTSNAYMRNGVADQVQNILNSRQVQVVAQTRNSFLDGLSLYAQRLDKGYSLTDCISMQTMRRQGIIQILTHDKHFAQESFVILLK
ncbi:PIN domain-containing protein [Acaryochloris sp. IP29b_bin.148]|uniref:type II toxin-antitoxin system VapC family toxin n=1 Tax=Acaryochloris sp. IP29b_bin.148 TaxID=2969218 RepID=UPI0026342D6F|nr:PIN domain-containing protein [Acaryochloris sp. IP29b_bin.148]